MLKKLLCAVFMLAAGSAQAAVVEYNYAGETLFPTQTYTQEDISYCQALGDCSAGFPESLPGVRVKIRIDESLVPGESLAGATFFYGGSWDWNSNQPNPPFPAYLKEFSLGIMQPIYYRGGEVGWTFGGWIFPEVAGGGYSFSFDQAKNLVSWRINNLCDGCAVDRLGISPGGSSVVLYEHAPLSAYYVAGPGAWSSPAAPIPLPATAWLMLGLIGGLGVKAWRARNQPAS